MTRSLDSMDVPSTQLDDASPENIKRLENFSHEIIEDNKFEFQQICHLLMNNRDRRQQEISRRKKWFNLDKFFLKS